MASSRVAVIADLVGSRLLADRRTAQTTFAETFAAVDAQVAHESPLRATVGDEFQGVYPTIAHALEATLLARLALPEGLDCRFGLGFGDVIDVGTSDRGVLQDGTGWWLARDAIVEAHKRESTRTPSLRSWFRSDDNPQTEALVNSYLLSRDHVVASMSARARRLAYGAIQNRSQAELAESEGITQSAVSQSWRRSGGANLLAAIDELREAGL